MPAHLAPENCYICGWSETEHSSTAEHAFWSNDDAARSFERHPNFDEDGGAAARYVDEYWGR